MPNLTTPLDLVLQQALSLPETGIAENYQSRLTSGNSNVCCLLLDTSGSMNSPCRGTDKRIDMLRQAVEAIDWQNYRLFTFDNTCRELTNPESLICSSGGTNLATGLSTIAKLKPCKTIVISDGEPNNEDDAIAEARKLTGTISTVYIGDDDKKAIAFMRKLSALGCGGSFVQDLGQGHAQLTTTINRLMLSSSN